MGSHAVDGTETHLAGRYAIGERVGKGGMASVFMALDTVEGCLVAVKIPHSQHGIGAVEREIDVLRRLSHPGIVAIRDHDRLPDGRPFLVLPLLSGPTRHSGCRNEVPCRQQRA